MGNSESANIAAHSAAGDAVQVAIKKEKRRAKRCCCCCFGITVGSIVAFIIGICLLVYFSSSLTDDYDPVNNMDQNTAKGLSYTGIAFIILGVILLLVSIGICVFVYALYRRFTGKGKQKVYVPKKFAPGTAPYPQQDWGEVPNPHLAPATTAASGYEPTAVDQQQQPLISPEKQHASAPVPQHAHPDHITPEIH